MPLTGSNIRKPYSYESVNTNGIWFGASSSYANLTDFKYVFKLNSYDISGWGSGTSQSVSNIGTFKIVPDPYSLCGYFTPHKALKSEIKNRLLYGPVISNNWAMFGYTASYLLNYDNSLVKYNVEFAVEYNPYTAIQKISPYNSSSVVFEFASFSNPDLAVNDVIRLSKTNPQYNPELNTVGSVIQVLGLTGPNPQARVGLSPASTVFADTGRIVYQKRIINTIATGSNNDYLYVNDSVKDLEYDWNVNDLKLWNNMFLTNMKTRNIFVDQYDSITLLMNPNDTNLKIDTTEVQLVNAAGSIYATYSYFTYPNNYAANGNYNHIRKWQLACGTADVKAITGNNLLLASSYNIVLRNLATGTSSTITRNIVDNCSKYDNVRIAWLNRLGGWDMFNFNMKSKMTSGIERQQTKTSLRYDYNVNNNLGARQYNSYNIDTQEIWTISTDWVNEDEWNLLKDLVTSPEVYIVNGLTYSGGGNSFILTNEPMPVPLITPINLTDTTWNSKTTLNDKIFNLSINYKKAYDKINHIR